jgi:hypothetical protein
MRIVKCHHGGTVISTNDERNDMTAFEAPEAFVVSRDAATEMAGLLHALFSGFSPSRKADELTSGERMILAVCAGLSLTVSTEDSGVRASINTPVAVIDGSEPGSYIVLVGK